MRQILILLALTSAPAFCQDDNANIQFHYNPQWFPKIGVSKRPPLFKVQIVQTEKVCSIPLLSAREAGTPVHMPTLSTPQGTRIPSDRMAVRPPVPACTAR